MGILNFTIFGADAAKAHLAAVQDAMKDLRPFWKDVFAPKYFGMVQDLFATGGRARGAGGRFGGGAWAPLSPKYAVWKKLHYPGRPILVREGDMRESVRWGGSQLGPGGIFDPQPSFVIAGTSIPYAARQNATRQFMPPPDPSVFAPLLQNWILRNAKGKK